jgi:hypothetical protein
MAQDENSGVKPINELKLNLLGKVFFVALAGWLVGKATNMKLRGSQEEIEAVSNAMMSSRRFQDELARPGASIDSVMDNLGLKHASAQEFERILGIPWPL